MIPKVIHYCWFGGNPLPELAIKCIESWRKYLPDYEIKEWNESNFDVNIIPYTRDAYAAKKYAFVSDYARFWILYNYGGLYFDTDVEVIKPMDDIISKGAFMGCENMSINGVVANIAPGLCLGAPKRHQIYNDILNFYKDLSINKSINTNCPETVVTITTSIFKDKGYCPNNNIQFIENVYIYPKDFFCPLDYETGILNITNNTYSIHHYTSSWLPMSVKIKNYIKKILYKYHLDNIIFVYKRIKKTI